jgi:hypothetical protein
MASTHAGMSVTPALIMSGSDRYRNFMAGRVADMELLEDAKGGE